MKLFFVCTDRETGAILRVDDRDMYNKTDEELDAQMEKINSQGSHQLWEKVEVDEKMSKIIAFLKRNDSYCDYSDVVSELRECTSNFNDAYNLLSEAEERLTELKDIVEKIKEEEYNVSKDNE